jgi:sugar/nucleoside kinase (ribokinase family)
MTFPARTLRELQAKQSSLMSKSAVVGLDGFVDTIVTPVAQREGAGEAFTPFATIADFGQRVLGAAGKSTNIELYPRMDKLGGNGPIMAQAILAAGAQVTYIGSLGRETLHPVFKRFAEKARVVSLADPAHTTAVEFTDGKLMLGQMKSLDEVGFDRILEVMGREEFVSSIAGADVVALTNWTMIPQMSQIFERLTTEILPNITRGERIFFFDLADPEKRTTSDLIRALKLITRFEDFGKVTLGLNLKEAQQVAAALGMQGGIEEDEWALRGAATNIRSTLGLSTVVIHPRKSAACATSTETAWVPGPYCEKPLITTGAGDHFNAGFVTAQMLGMRPEACLGIGVATSGFYVRTAQSPTIADLETFLAKWE